MTKHQLNTLLKTTGFPVVFHHFKKPQQSPYITYLATENQHGSDEENLIIDASYRVELYVSAKDLKLEKKLDDLFSFVEFEKDITFIEETELYLISYEFDITYKK